VLATKTPLSRFLDLESYPGNHTPLGDQGGSIIQNVVSGSPAGPESKMAAIRPLGSIQLPRSLLILDVLKRVVAGRFVSVAGPHQAC
jgi:hypothetical protein